VPNGSRGHAILPYERAAEMHFKDGGRLEVQAEGRSRPGSVDSTHRGSPAETRDLSPGERGAALSNGGQHQGPSRAAEIQRARSLVSRKGI
jgi:hypothetical protein